MSATVRARLGALEWHLASNHYPPISLAFVPAANAAVHACNEGDPERLIILPDDLTVDGQLALPAARLVELMHLDDFLEDEPDDMTAEEVYA